MLHASIQVVVFFFGALMLLGGVVAASDGSGAAIGSGVWAIVFGAVLMVAAVVQRGRYRSGEAERTHAEPGPGGGEAGFMEPRFLPTIEQFRDPTTGIAMRVFVDPRTGERRYRAEG
jgi:hypothetical protein